jgi:hypothetical protein
MLCTLLLAATCAASPRPLELKFQNPSAEASRYRVPLQLDALYRYPIKASLPPDWGLSSPERSQLVAALLIYPPATSSFEGVTLTDETGKSFPKLSDIFVDAHDRQLGAMNALVDSGPTRLLAFFEVPESVKRVSIVSGRAQIPGVRIDTAGTAYQPKVEQTFSVKSAGWVSSPRRFVALVQLNHYHRDYDGLDLALSDSQHARKTPMSQVDPRLVLEVDERLVPHELPATPLIISERLILVVYQPPAEWTTPDWLLGLGLPPLDDMEKKLPAQTLRRVGGK